MRRTAPPDIQREPLPKRMVEYSVISTLNLPWSEFVRGMGAGRVLIQTNPPPTAMVPLPTAGFDSGNKVAALTVNSLYGAVAFIVNPDRSLSHG